jgi:hypothetical protein
LRITAKFGGQCPSRVKTGKPQSEHKFSGLPSTADIGVRGWRFSCVPTPDIRSLATADDLSMDDVAINDDHRC